MCRYSGPLSLAAEAEEGDGRQEVVEAGATNHSCGEAAEEGASPGLFATRVFLQQGVCRVKAREHRMLSAEEGEGELCRVGLCGHSRRIHSEGRNFRDHQHPRLHQDPCRQYHQPGQEA